jgi:hypothetical protein
MSEANPGFDIVGDLLALSRTEEPSSLLPRRSLTPLLGLLLLG